MLIVELHGFFGETSKDSPLNEVLDAFVKVTGATEELILELTADAAYAGELRVSTNFSDCEDRQQKSSPSLRVWGTNQEHLDDLVGRLMQIDVDIQVAPLLSQFIERKSVREAAIEKLKSLRPTSGTDKEYDYPSVRELDGTPVEDA